MDWTTVTDRDKIPAKIYKAGEALTLGEFRKAVESLPQFTWPDLGWSDEGGFDSGLGGHWLYYCDGDLFWLTETWCPVRYHDTIRFRDFKIDRQIRTRRRKISEWIKELDDLPADTKMFLAIKIDKSRFGDHYYLPFECAGPSVYVGCSDPPVWHYDNSIMSVWAHKDRTKVSDESADK